MAGNYHTASQSHKQPQPRAHKAYQITPFDLLRITTHDIPSHKQPKPSNHKAFNTYTKNQKRPRIDQKLTKNPKKVPKSLVFLAFLVN